MQLARGVVETQHPPALAHREDWVHHNGTETVPF
jgi:hypothetical protein